MDVTNKAKIIILKKKSCPNYVRTAYKVLKINIISRDDWIRTSGLFVPNEARYRAALHPVVKNGCINLRLNWLREKNRMDNFMDGIRQKSPNNRT